MPQQPLNHPEFSREPNHSRLQVDDSVCFPSHDQDKFPDTDSIRGVDEEQQPPCQWKATSKKRKGKASSNKPAKPCGNSFAVLLDTNSEDTDRVAPRRSPQKAARHCTEHRGGDEGHVQEQVQHLDQGRLPPKNWKIVGYMPHFAVALILIVGWWILNSGGNEPRDRGVLEQEL